MIIKNFRSDLQFDTDKPLDRQKFDDHDRIRCYEIDGGYKLVIRVWKFKSPSEYKSDNIKNPYIYCLFWWSMSGLFFGSLIAAIISTAMNASKNMSEEIYAHYMLGSVVIFTVIGIFHCIIKAIKTDKNETTDSFKEYDETITITDKLIKYKSLKITPDINRIDYLRTENVYKYISVISNQKFEKEVLSNCYYMDYIIFIILFYFNKMKYNHSASAIKTLSPE